MILTADNVGKSTPEWDAQRERIRLSRTLLGGTRAMQQAGEAYLPKRVGGKEKDDEYEARKNRSVLLNEYKRTVTYLVGQVFQKPVKYQEAQKGKAVTYDKAFFETFQEDVDTQGNNISMFCKKVFREAMPDGVDFILSEYPAIQLAEDEDGKIYYQDDDGNWRPRTQRADKENGWRPYWVLITSKQVLDAWIDHRNGRSVLLAFRYRETLLRETPDGGREIVERVRAIFPDHWEVWEATGSDKTFKKIGEGKNALGIVPVDWFMPGEQTDETPGLTALPALDDLAEMNRAHWQAYSDHKGLMEYGRAPAWLLKALTFPRDSKGNLIVTFGPNHFCATEKEYGDIRSVGVDAASIANSFQDLKAMEDYMGLYGLQLILPQGSTTATQAQIAAASSDSALKGWVQQLQDCMENALKKIAMWQAPEGQRDTADGPAIFINSEFRVPYDAATVQQLSNMVDKGQLPSISLYTNLRKMDLIGEDMTYEDYINGIMADEKRKEESLQNMGGYTPRIGGNIPNEGGQNINNQQSASGEAQG